MDRHPQTYHLIEAQLCLGGYISIDFHSKHTLSAAHNGREQRRIVAMAAGDELELVAVHSSSYAVASGSLAYTALSQRDAVGKSESMPIVHRHWPLAAR